MDKFEQIRSSKLPVVIFGAGFAGQVLLNTCKDNGINVAAFCDNKKNYSGSFLLGCKIIHSGELHELFPEAHFIVAAADINDVVIQLKDFGYSDYTTGGSLLKHSDLTAHTYDTEFDFLEYAVSTCIQCHDAFEAPEKLFLRSVDIVITEKCSMRCKDCSNLMQYYTSPEHHDAELLLNSLTSFFKQVDAVNEFRIIGGEPFMNKEIHQVVSWLINEPKVGRVVIYTNGTIVPKGANIEALKHNKVLMMITDYDELSRNHGRLIETLNEHKIAYHTDKAQNWTDCASIEFRGRTQEQNKEVFKNCCAKSLFTIMDGKFYRCPFTAHVDKLAATPIYSDDYVELLSPSLRKDALQRSLREYIQNKDCLESCNFCAGRFLSDEKITPGVQVNEPIKFIIYER